jgi:hypothetical protein
MTGSTQRFRFVLHLTVAALLTWTRPAPAASVPLATISSDGAVVSWTPLVDTAGITLAIADPAGRVQHFPFAAGDRPTLPLVDDDGQPLADGTYTWELRVRVVPADPSGTRRVSADGRRLRLGRVHTQSGVFTIAGGQLLIPEDEAVDKGLVEKDQLVPDDLIVDGRACIGLACTNNETFAGEALLLKQSVVRLRFDDTSTAAGFPTTNWQLRANDAGSGGADLFAIEDLSASTIPFTVRGGAPSSSVYIAASGNVGVGTAVPTRKLDVSGDIGTTGDLYLKRDETPATTRLHQFVAPTDSLNNAPSVTWASYAGFVTPTADASSFGSIYALYLNGGTAGSTRMFGYLGSISTSFGALTACGIQNCRAGVRLDDGTNNNYVELFIETLQGTDAGLVKLRYRTATAGVVSGPTDLWGGLKTVSEFMWLKVAQAGGAYYLYAGKNNVFQPVVYAATFGWTPTRFGFYAEHPTGGTLDIQSAAMFDAVVYQ